MSKRRDSIAQALAVLAPNVPRFEHADILDHAMDSPGLRNASPQAAAWLCLIAHIRHRHTDYETLLDQGYDEDSARHFVTDHINAILGDWGCRKRL